MTHYELELTRYKLTLKSISLRKKSIMTFLYLLFFGNANDYFTDFYTKNCCRAILSQYTCLEQDAAWVIVQWKTKSQRKISHMIHETSIAFYGFAKWILKLRFLLTTQNSLDGGSYSTMRDFFQLKKNSKKMEKVTSEYADSSHRKETLQILRGFRWRKLLHTY